MSQFVFQARDFTDLILPRLEYRVRRYRRAALGGPRDAEVEVIGSREQLFELVEHLRAPVEIFNENHEAVWWGYISSVEINWGGVQFGVSLDTMANKVAVAYTESQVRKTTAYTSNATSTADYGIIEELLSRSEITTSDAEQYRDTYLEAHRYPVPTINMIGDNFGIGRGVIRCKGWMSSLDWRMYSNDEGKESYEAIGSSSPGREIGEDERPIFAQAFQLSSTDGWTTNAIWIRLWKRGSPTDNFQLALKSDSAGDPGTTLASATLAGANVNGFAEWTEFTLSSEVALSTGTTYWIHCSRSGAVDLDNYFVIGVNKDLGYANGDPKYYNTDLSDWVDASHKGDMNFRVMGDTATDEQISDIVTNVGEFFTGVDVVDTSGIDTNAYRAGDKTALYELMRLLSTGTTNDRRLLCEVTRPRVMKVYEEPAEPTASTGSYSLTSGGVLFTSYGRRVRPSDCTVGVWCNLGDVVPATVDLSRISNPSVFFIEEAEYDVLNDRYRILRTRDQRDVFALGGLQ